MRLSPHAVRRSVGILHQLAPPQHIAQIKLPRRSHAAIYTVDHRVAKNGLVEGHHLFDNRRRQTRMQCFEDECEIGRVERIQVDLGKAVQEAARQALAPAALRHRVLRGEHAEGRRALKGAIELGQVD